MTAEKTKIKASYIIAFDGTRHRYLRDGELVYEGQDIIYAGKSYAGEVAKTIDAKGKIISPGFISTHAHLSESPIDRSFVEDAGKPQFYFSGLYEMLKRHGKTPIAWLRDIGFLQDNVILGHAIIVGGTSWTNYPAGDLDIMAETGCSLAHAPWVFARRGIIMESFCKYQQAGINMTLGTDTCPQDMIQAMRWAAVPSKIVERNTKATTAADVFNAATLGAAEALGREDLGRLCAGAKADFVVFSGDSTNIVPLRDPVKNIVYSAETKDVEMVFINGKPVVEDGKVLGCDERMLNQKMQSAGEKLWSRISSHDWANRSTDELSPLSFDPM